MQNVIILESESIENQIRNINDNVNNNILIGFMFCLFRNYEDESTNTVSLIDVYTTNIKKNYFRL